ncbi:MAG: low-specificity L-threonine aldolase [Deltaproteobacteria bacterium]|nr:low-specificity L-threonine aldolase [Deltaproteobacteria bacterium]
MVDRDVIDLRSDTVTLPTAGMREAMMDAELGDDVYGEDPTVNALEAAAAGMLGKEAGLFVPSGSQANLVSLLTYGVRGDEVILGQESHCMKFEAGAGVAIAGAQFSVVPGDGLFTADQVRERLQVETLHNPGTGLVWIENTHNMGGGRIFSIEEMERVAGVCREQAIPLHVDGARIFNAAVATDLPASRYAGVADSISVCLSKGLGAPVGSVLTGTRTFCEKSRRFRKMLGGAMRQAGVLAAAGLYALENNVERLAQDHDNSRALAEGLAAVDGIEVDVATVETNIVMAETTRIDAATFAERCRAQGVLFHPLAERRIRFVTHLDVDRRMVLDAVDRMKEVLAA